MHHPVPVLPPDLSPDRLERITVCLRPFRGAGPRLEMEEIAGRPVIHNYGHGGAGWSLSWGCAEEVLDLVRPYGGPVAVLGAGAMGLTTAAVLAGAGYAVTIYAREFPPETRSARATGSWSPESRIALSAEAPPGFYARWEGWAARAYGRHSRYLDSPGVPVEFSPRYMLRDHAEPERSRAFVGASDAIRALGPPTEPIAPKEYGFTPPHGDTASRLAFNLGAYTQRIMADYDAAGGRLERAAFAGLDDILALSEPVIVNCTGYGARALFGDDSVIPVRGQIAWLPAEPGLRYGIYYRGGTVLARRDGIVIQDRGLTDDWGYGRVDETPDDAEFRRILAVMRSAFAAC